MQLRRAWSGGMRPVIVDLMRSLGVQSEPCFLSIRPLTTARKYGRWFPIPREGSYTTNINRSSTSTERHCRACMLRASSVARLDTFTARAATLQNASFPEEMQLNTSAVLGEATAARTAEWR